MKTYKIALLSIDSPSYFSGYHLSVLQIALTQKTYTNKEMAQEIEDEINSFGFFQFEDFPQHQQLYIDYINDLLKKPNDLFFDGSDMDQTYFDMLGSEDLDEYLYFYFAPISPKIINNITFLD